MVKSLLWHSDCDWGFAESMLELVMICNWSWENNPWASSVTSGANCRDDNPGIRDDDGRVG